MTTFDPAWMAEHDIIVVQSLPLPGFPMLLVQHKIGGIKFEFLAKLQKPEGYDDMLPAERAEAVLAGAMRQIEVGIEQRRASLVGSLL